MSKDELYRSKLSIVALLVFLFLATLNLSGQSSIAPVKDSATEVQYARAAQADPLSDLAREQRKLAMSFAENDHSSHVLLCQQVFQQLTGNHAANAGEINLQYVISAAAFLYEHPEAATDSIGQNLAGIDAALNVYEKFLATEPKSKSKFLDSLLKQRADGKLREALSKICK